MSGRFEALVFDMDGVLVDSEPIHFEVTRSLMRKEGVDLPWVVYLDYVGTTLEETWEGLIARYELKGSIEEFLPVYEAAVLDALRQELEAEPGARELLSAAKDRGIRLALASSSNKSWVDATLAGLEMTGAFEVIVSGDMVDNGKPSPDIFLEAARRIQVAPERCIAIEDSPKGVTSAHTAGMYTIGLRKPYNDENGLAPADEILNSLEEFDLTLL